MIDTDRDYERIFVGNRQIDIRHFYQVGDNIFSAGYMTHDGNYIASLYQWDNYTFNPIGDALYSASPIVPFVAGGNHG